MYSISNYQMFLINRIKNTELKAELQTFFRNYNNVMRIKRMLKDIEDSNLDTEVKESFMYAVIKDK